jgi:uncharacterized protein with PIN domain
MTTLYAESSAVLAWLLGEPGQRTITKALEDADEVVTSAITAVECTRGLLRARLDRRINAVEEMAALRLLSIAVEGWHVVELSDAVMAAARHPLPREPVRTLDALHLASAILVQAAIGDLVVLSLDERVRSNAVALQMVIAPPRQ